MMALANTYGLLFIILLLGQGLIQVPRQLWETSFNDMELQRLYFNATQVWTQPSAGSQHTMPCCCHHVWSLPEGLHRIPNLFPSTNNTLLRKTKACLVGRYHWSKVS